jgi:hypothetical protein
VSDLQARRPAVYAALYPITVPDPQPVFDQLVVALQQPCLTTHRPVLPVDLRWFLASTDSRTLPHDILAHRRKQASTHHTGVERLVSQLFPPTNCQPRASQIDLDASTPTIGRSLCWPLPTGDRCHS